MLVRRTQMAERVGFVGIGTMGTPMTLNLLKAGFSVTAYDIMPAGLETVVKAGARRADSLREVAEASDVIITMLPSPVELEAAIYGPAGLLAHLQAGKNLIDMSTMDPVATRKVAADAAKIGVGMIDAPVSGGTVGAVNGTLTIMVGGSAASFARAEPVLRAMGRPHHLGPVGMGETVKLVNQIIIANVMIANVEGLVFAQRAGADLGTVREVLASATASNYLLAEWLPKTWLAGSFQGGFALDLLRKDLAAALDAARATNLPMPATGLAYQLYTTRSAEGDGALDYSAIAKAYEWNGDTAAASDGRQESGRQ